MQTTGKHERSDNPTCSGEHMTAVDVLANKGGGGGSQTDPSVVTVVITLKWWRYQQKQERGARQNLPTAVNGVLGGCYTQQASEGGRGVVRCAEKSWCGSAG